jgi:hypothetical protein
VYEMPVLPLIFDTTLVLGATKLHDTCPFPFLHIRGRFETLAAVLTFSPFWAGKSRRHAGKAIAHLFFSHGVSPTKPNKNTKGRGPRMNNGREMIFRKGDETLGGKTKITIVADVEIRRT